MDRKDNAPNTSEIELLVEKMRAKAEAQVEEQKAPAADAIDLWDDDIQKLIQQTREETAGAQQPAAPPSPQPPMQPAVDQKAYQAARESGKEAEKATSDVQIGVPGSEGGDAEQQEEDTPPVPTQPNILVRIIRNGLEAELELQRTSEHTLDPLYEDVLKEVSSQGIVFGINDTIIQQLCKQPVYNRPYVIARGYSPKVGKDGWIKYLVRTKRELRPTIREDGTADFKDLNYLQLVEKHQVLCEIYNAEKGADGCDVMGTILEGQYGRPPMEISGQNTVYNQNRSQLLAACEGSVEVKQGVVAVLDVLKVPGSVDNSTGDINFTGDIIINGDVLSGFTVRTRGSIMVKGSVEGATVEAGGDITVGQTVNGMNRGVLIAQGDLKCKHIQSCYLRAEGNIYADTLLYCSIECNGNVDLSGKRATIVGGRALIAGRLTAKTIGATTHAATEIDMCATGLSKNHEAEQIQGNIAYLDNEIVKLIQILTRYEEIAKKKKLSPEQVQSIMAVKMSYVQFTEQRKQFEQALEQLKREQLEASRENSYVQCSGKIHYGARFTFGPLAMQVTDSYTYCRIQVVGDSIRVSPL